MNCNVACVFERHTHSSDAGLHVVVELCNANPDLCSIRLPDRHVGLQGRVSRIEVEY